MAKKYRVGRAQGRAILEVETGKEYLLFPVGSELACAEYCDYLNNKQQISPEEIESLADQYSEQFRYTTQSGGWKKLCMEDYIAGFLQAKNM